MTNKIKSPHDLKEKKIFKFRFFSNGSVFLALFLALGSSAIVIQDKLTAAPPSYALIHVGFAAFCFLYFLFGMIWISKHR